MMGEKIPSIGQLELLEVVAGLVDLTRKVGQPKRFGFGILVWNSSAESDNRKSEHVKQCMDLVNCLR
jgi:hypothetical protein